MNEREGALGEDGASGGGKTRARRGSGRPTIADVARRAGVGAITVSRSLRHPERVSPRLRQRINAAIEALGYVPDAHARALASARSDVVGVLVPSLANNVFAEVLRGVYDGLDGGPLQVQLGNTRYSGLEEERLLRVFLRQRPAALIVTGVDQTPAARALLETADCPVVQIMEVGAEPVDMLVGFSHFEGGRTVTRHMIEAGYRRIAFVGARMDPRSLRRLEGYRAAVAEAGLADERLVTTTTAPSSVPLGRELFRQALAAVPSLDAIVCNNDDLALGVLFECNRAGIDVPGRIGLAGFNDLEMSEVAFPSITSVHTPRYEIGLRAVEMARAAIAGRRPAQTVVDLGFTLRIRESTRRPA